MKKPNQPINQTKKARCSTVLGVEMSATRGSRVNTVQVVALAQKRSLDIPEVRLKDQTFLFVHS